MRARMQLRDQLGGAFQRGQIAALDIELGEIDALSGEQDVVQPADVRTSYERVIRGKELTADTVLSADPMR